MGQRWVGWFQPQKAVNGINSMVSCMLSGNVVSFYGFFSFRNSLLAALTREWGRGWCRAFFVGFVFWVVVVRGFGFDWGLLLGFFVYLWGFFTPIIFTFLLPLCSVAALCSNLYQGILQSLSNFCGQMLKLFWMRYSICQSNIDCKNTDPSPPHTLQKAKKPCEKQLFSLKCMSYKGNKTQFQ